MTELCAPCGEVPFLGGIGIANPGEEQDTRVCVGGVGWCSQGRGWRRAQQ